MKQSRATSFVKSCISTAVGFGVSFVAQLVFLPLLGVEIGIAQNTAFAVIMTVISVARGYVMERIFEWARMTVRLSPGMLAIIAERRRQIDVEGWTIEHDDDLATGELAHAGACYAMADRPVVASLPDGDELIIDVRCLWAWDFDWWKPDPRDRRRNLVRAGALILAELERHDRNRKPRQPLPPVRPAWNSATRVGWPADHEPAQLARGKTRSTHGGSSA